MLISDFVRATGLSRDTVRFYVSLGILQPQKNGKGGRHPYQFFTADDVRNTEIIRESQLLGMSLKKIKNITKERREGRYTRERQIEIAQGQLNTLEAKAAELQAMIAYLRAKIAWVESGERDVSPDIGAFMAGATIGSVSDPEPEPGDLFRR
jgi:MerR family copper efflux transcriptional regulator